MYYVIEDDIYLGLRFILLNHRVHKDYTQFLQIPGATEKYLNSGFRILVNICTYHCKSYIPTHV